MSDPLQAIENSELAAVTFVRDYIQLSFDGPGLTINAGFTIYRNERSFKKGDASYRDALCETIGKTVKKAFTVNNEDIVIQFADGSEIKISLRAEDQVGPEAAILYLSSRPIYVW